MPDPSHPDQSPPGTDERATLVALSRELGRPDRGWALLAEGNTSLRVGADAMLVKASGVSMARAGAEDFVGVALSEVLALVDSPNAGDEDVRVVFEAAAARAGGRRPSVEALLHAVCLDLPGVTTVGHTHPVAVNGLLCSARPSLLTEGSLFPDQVVVLGTNPLLVPYIDPGLRLAQAVRTMLVEHLAATGAPPKVIYLQNHGLFALGASSTEVLQVTEMAVKVASVVLGTLAAGGPVYLDPAEVARIDTRPDELLRRAALAAAQSGPTSTSRSS